MNSHGVLSVLADSFRIYVLAIFARLPLYYYRNNTRNHPFTLMRHILSFEIGWNIDLLFSFPNKANDKRFSTVSPIMSKRMNKYVVGSTTLAIVTGLIGMIYLWKVDLVCVSPKFSLFFLLYPNYKIIAM